MRLFDEQGWPNFSEEDGIFSTGANIIFIWGGRGTGKTYTVLKKMIEQQEHFLFLRRTPGQAETITAGAEMSPFTPLNIDNDWNYMPFKIPKASCLYRVGNATEKTETGAWIEPEDCRGVISSVVTLGRTRGFSSPKINYIILDEYQKDDLDYYRKGEGVALANLYETVNRNREFQGKQPCKLLCMSNAVGMANPYFLQWDIVDIVDEMVGTNRRWRMLPDRGILLVDLADSPIAAMKKDTAIFKSLAGTDFYRSALNNQYAAEERSKTASRKLNLYVPLVAVGRLCIYKAKSGQEYYITQHLSGSPEQYGTGHYDLARFRARYKPLYMAYMARKIVFERYTDEIYFRQLWEA